MFPVQSFYSVVDMHLCRYIKNILTHLTYLQYVAYIYMYGHCAGSVYFCGVVLGAIVAVTMIIILVQGGPLTLSRSYNFSFNIAFYFGHAIPDSGILIARIFHVAFWHFNIVSILFQVCSCGNN